MDFHDIIFQCFFFAVRFRGGVESGMPPQCFNFSSLLMSWRPPVIQESPQTILAVLKLYSFTWKGAKGTSLDFGLTILGIIYITQQEPKHPKILQKLELGWDLQIADGQTHAQIHIVRIFHGFGPLRVVGDR